MAFSEGLHDHGRLQPHLGSECKKRKPTMISLNEAVKLDVHIKFGPRVIDNRMIKLHRQTTAPRPRQIRFLILAPISVYNLDFLPALSFL